MEPGDSREKLEDETFQSTDAKNLADFLQSKLESKDNSYKKISTDDIEKIRLIGVLLSKMENLPPSKFTGVDGNEWKVIGQGVFPTLKFLLDDMQRNRIIASLQFFIGGGCIYSLVDRRKYALFLYDEVKGILSRCGTSNIPKESVETEIIQRREIEINDTLVRFKRFVERDGYLAFWNESSCRNGLKNRPEEIARAEFMSFLAGMGLFDRGQEFREVPEGAGRLDVIRIEEGGIKRIFELKVVSDTQNRYEEGFTQLVEYLSKEDTDVGYYIVLFATSSQDRPEEFQRLMDGKRILITVIELYQIPPTARSNSPA